MRSQDHDVVVVRRTINLGYWEFGMGRGSERGGQFTSNLRQRWTGSYHTKEGFQVSKGNRREAKGNQQGEVKSKGIAPCYVVNLYICT